MLVKIFSSAVHGVEAIPITIEVNVMQGQGYFIVGLPDSSVKESLQRTESAIKTNGYKMPRTKLVINLSPADIRKSGAAFDLAIATGILAASGQLEGTTRLSEFIIMGELNLDGTVQPVKGILSIALQACSAGFKNILVPRQNASEAALVSGLAVYGIAHIGELTGFFNKPGTLCPTKMNAGEAFVDSRYGSDTDFSEVKGQENIKRAFEIAAAGGHNALLIGPPGSGKTMLARRLPTILPPLSFEEALETTKIHSVAGKLSGHTTLITQRPFRSPHHTVSPQALAGGGAFPQPGEISLAHNGVLFLDELPEFRRETLEIMRQPMEERKLTISRVRYSFDFPANFMLIASMNPCPCGFYNHPEKECTCPPGAVQKYLSRISGPLLDRIDLQVEIAPLSYAQLVSPGSPQQSKDIRERVLAARAIQTERFRAEAGIHANAHMADRHIRQVCTLNVAGHQLLRTAMDRLDLSARAYNRILKVSRTIADLAGSATIEAEHLAEAVQYRSMDRAGWGC